MPRWDAVTFHHCERCGVNTQAQFCRDCREVDPDMTAGGLSARQMGHRMMVRYARERVDELEMQASLSSRNREKERARRQAEKLRRLLTTDPQQA